MKFAFVDSRISQEEIYALSKLDFTLILCPQLKNLYEAISGHPDIQVNIVDNSSIIVHKDFPLDLIKKISNYEVRVYKSLASLDSKYPKDIFLNAVTLKNFFIHNLKFTDKNLLNLVKDKTLIHTNQGYTKCSTAIVTNKAIITSDISIKKSLSCVDIDVLFVPPGHIILPGLDYGFIGGTCGLIDEGTLGFFGDLKNYKYGEEILKFLIVHDVKPIYLKRGPLIDRGSLLTIR